MAALASSGASSSSSSVTDAEFAALGEVLEADGAQSLPLDYDFLFALNIQFEAEGLESVKDKLWTMLDGNRSGVVTPEAWRDFSSQWHASGQSIVDFVTTSGKATGAAVKEGGTAVTHQGNASAEPASERADEAGNKQEHGGSVRPSHAIGAPRKAPPLALKHNGLYIHSKLAAGGRDRTLSIIRIFEDFTVASVSVSPDSSNDSETAQMVSRWLVKPTEAQKFNYSYSKERLSSDGDSLSFSTTNEDGGTVDYEGSLDSQGNLLLSSHSHINGYVGPERCHRFYPISSLHFRKMAAGSAGKCSFEYKRSISYR